MMPQPRAWYPLLFAVQPVLSLYATNSEEVRFASVLFPLGVVFVIAALLLAGLNALLRDSTRAALIASLLLIGFFSFGYAMRAWSEAGLPGDARIVVGALWSLSVAALSTAVVRTHLALGALGRGAAAVAVVLTALPPLQLGIAWARARGDSGRAHGVTALVSAPGAPASVRQGAPPRRPDIYYIVLDGYARNDAMRDIYGFDNTPFLDWLRQHGFQVAENSRANYCKTLHAMASSLNMEYLHDLMDVVPTAVDSKPLIELVRRNRTVHLLREHGYGVVAFPSGYDLAEFSKIDHYLKPGASWSEFANVLISTTPMPMLLGERGDPHALHRRRLQYILDELPRIRDGSQPRFVFAHLLAPHPPFVFDRDGRARAVARPFGLYDGSDYIKHGGTVEEYIEGYAEQARWVTRRLQTALEALIENYGDEPPIVIVHSDHGPGSRLDWKSVPDTDMNERFGILMAAYLPGQPAVDLGASFSPVNAFRLIFDVYFGAGMGPLEHRSYYTFQSLPFRFIDVTNPDNPLELEASLKQR